MTLEFTNPRESRADVTILDLLGREAARLARGRSRAGLHHAQWNGRTSAGPAPAGIYFVRYRHDEGVVTRRFLLRR